MASHVERLKQSSCYINSEMTCVTCHNPHKSVKSLGENYFDKKCMDCHDLCKEEENISDCSSCHMPMSSSSDIPHVTITDHKISVPNNDSIYNIDNSQREFLGLIAINNDRPTNLSKAKGYLKRFESFESNPLYLDSAFVFLKNSEVDEVFPFFVQYYYLKKDYFSLINYYLTIEKERLNLYSSEELSLAYSRVADAFSNNGLVDEAITLFNQAVELSPYILDYKLKLAVLLINSNRFLEAENVLEELLSLNSERKEVYLNFGYLNILRMQFDKAEENLKRAVKLDPDYLLAYENLALLYIKKNNLFLARKNLEVILKLNPNAKKAKQMLNKIN
jgi:tetratricopeptide (TPR) repeat protein